MEVMDEIIRELQKKCMAKARREVAAEIKQAKADMPVLKKELSELRRWRAGHQRRLEKLEERETDLKLAVKEVCFIMDKIDKIREEKVTTKVTTTSVRNFAHGSNDGMGWYGTRPTIKAKALSAIRRRFKKMSAQPGLDQENDGV